MLIAATTALIALILLTPEPALAWGPVTHIAQAMQVLATVASPERPLQAALLSLPEVFLYGSLAPDIVQGRRLQSRLRRHSHNWMTGLTLLEKSADDRERAFALGYLAHLGGDVVAHNFYLPARLIGRFTSRLSGHIYFEACFDSLQHNDYRDLLLKLLAVDFEPLDAMLERAIDWPLISFAAHRRIFEGGLRRIKEWDRLIRALGGAINIEPADAELFSTASCSAIEDLLAHGEQAHACRFDPMGRHALLSANAARRNLQRLLKLGPAARKTAHGLAHAMLEELRAHLRQTRFGPPPTGQS